MRRSTYNPPNARLATSVTQSSKAARQRLIGLGDNAVWRIAMKTARGLKVAMAALALAQAGTALLVWYFPSGTPRLTEIRMDWHALAFTAAISMLTGIAFGLIPAIHASRPDPQQSLRSGGRTMVGGRGYLLKGFVIAEIAVSVIVV